MWPQSVPVPRISVQRFNKDDLSTENVEFRTDTHTMKSIKMFTESESSNNGFAPSFPHQHYRLSL